MCGVFGIWDHQSAVYLTYLGLLFLQHRGQESTGIVTDGRGKLKIHTAMGLVEDVYTQSVLDSLGQHCMAAGHTRYSTCGSSNLINAQPHKVEFPFFQMAGVDNGDIRNYQELRQLLEDNGYILESDNDDEVILKLIAYHYYRNGCKDFLGAIMAMAGQVRGAFSLILMTSDNEMYVVRGPCGIRPLVVGRKGEAWVFASESCAFKLVGARYEREVQRGEIIQLNSQGVNCYLMEDLRKRYSQATCTFENVYFSRPDSIAYIDENGDPVSVWTTRFQMGRELAKRHPADADIVASIPSGGDPLAAGFAAESGIPFLPVIWRNPYVPRTFIEPLQWYRDFLARLKYSVIFDVVKGKRLVLVDDSVVRGTTLSALVGGELKESSKVKEVHGRMSHLFLNECYYGINIPNLKELVGPGKSFKELAERTVLDSFGCLPIETIATCCRLKPEKICLGCAKGEYPI